MPSNSETGPSLDILDEGTAEKEMRRALGLERPVQGRQNDQKGHSGQAFHSGSRPSHRFVQDGEVKVVVLQGRRDHASQEGHLRAPVNRLEAAETALKAEREARERAERALADTQAIVQDLQTKLGHTALALDELREAVRAAEAERQSAEAALAAEGDARQKAEEALQQIRARRAVKTVSTASQPTEDMPLSDAAEAAVRVKTANRPVQTHHSEPEPEPVKWWLKPKAPTARRRAKKLSS
jgi:chromosome segregation ATPase